jgi:hypothetical protein
LGVVGDAEVASTVSVKGELIVIVLLGRANVLAGNDPEPLGVVALAKSFSVVEKV